MVTKQHPAWLYIVFPAIAMLLGWGLRGYIGGGPFGALIPGCFVALSLCLLLGYRMETAAMGALFGAVGVGYGGDMTYGQTLGFLMEPETVSWGLLGCAVKGGVWGLLGGAVLGVGLLRDRFHRNTLVIAFIITMIAYYVGVKLINEPKLIYFSNRFDEPRDESWAGLLFAALALLAYLRNQGTKNMFAIPRQFALWGALGGALGFSGGALWMVFGPDIPIEQRWVGWWKAMEFSFGFVFGAALGYCAYRNRGRLYDAGQEGEAPPAVWWPMWVFLAFTAVIFISYPMLGKLLPEGFRESTALGHIILRDIIGVLFGFIFFGGICIILGLRSLHVAWQTAITLTFFHTVLDFTRDLSEPKNFGYTLPVSVQITILLAATALAGLLVYRFQRGPKPVHRLYLLAVWSCYLTACARSYFYKDLFFPPEGKTALTVVLEDHPTLFFVHGTFTLSAAIVTWFVLTKFVSDEGETAGFAGTR